MESLNRKIEEVRRLLWLPTPENIMRATRTLEAIALEMRAIQETVKHGECAAGLELDLAEFRLKFAGVRVLLERSAKFFSGLSGLRPAPAYQRDGLLTTQQYMRRPIALM